MASPTKATPRRSKRLATKRQEHLTRIRDTIMAIQDQIEGLDPDPYPAHLFQHLQSLVYCVAEFDELARQFDPEGDAGSNENDFSGFSTPDSKVPRLDEATNNIRRCTLQATKGLNISRRVWNGRADWKVAVGKALKDINNLRETLVALRHSPISEL